MPRMGNGQFSSGLTVLQSASTRYSDLSAAKWMHGTLYSDSSMQQEPLISPAVGIGMLPSLSPMISSPGHTMRNRRSLGSANQMEFDCSSAARQKISPPGRTVAAPG